MMFYRRFMHYKNTSRSTKMLPSAMDFFLLLLQLNNTENNTSVIVTFDRKEHYIYKLETWNTSIFLTET